MPGYYFHPHIAILSAIFHCYALTLLHALGREWMGGECGWKDRSRVATEDGVEVVRLRVIEN